MRKPLLATLFMGASVISLSAVAQVHLGGAAQVGAGVHAGDAGQAAMHSVDRTGAQANQTLRRTGAHAKHTTHHTIDHTRTSVRHERSANEHVNASGSAGVRTSNNRAGAGANANLDTRAHVDTRHASQRAEGDGHAAGTALRHDSDSAVHAAHRAAGSADGAVDQTTSARSVDTHAKLDARAEARGH